MCSVYHSLLLQILIPSYGNNIETYVYDEAIRIQLVPSSALEMSTVSVIYTFKMCGYGECEAARLLKDIGASMTRRGGGK